MGNPEETLRAREKLYTRIEKDVRKKMEDESKLNQEGDASKANNDCKNNNGLGGQGREQETTANSNQTHAQALDENAIIGVSNYVRTLREEICAIANNTDIVLILIEGPTGTGKDLVANVIHNRSGRNPFVTQNCAAIPRDQFEVEMFGALKGSYTGAIAGRTGRVEEANRGTLFLDEIGELSLENQSKLLRFLDNFKYRKLDSTVEQKTEVRLIAATNRDLVRAVAEGSFREDLHHRLSQHVIHTKPLIENIEDVICLVNHFLAQSETTRMSYDPWSKLLLYYYTFPGNVRELKNLIGKTPEYIRSYIQTRIDEEAHSEMKNFYGMDQYDEDLLYFDEEIDSWKEQLSFIKQDFSSEDNDNLNLLRDAIKNKILLDEERNEAHKLYEEILEKKRIADRDYLDRVIEHGLRVFEILVLRQKAKLNTDKLHEAMHIRYHSVQEIKERYRITFPHGKNLYEITTPLQMLPEPELNDDEEEDEDEEVQHSEYHFTVKRQAKIQKR